MKKASARARTVHQGTFGKEVGNVDVAKEKRRQIKQNSIHSILF